MNIFERRSELPYSAETLYAYHCNPGAFGRLTPPWESVRVREADEGIKEGDVRHLRIGPGPLALPWTAVHKDFVEGRQFADVQEKGPFRSWRHEHTFEPLDENRAALRDRIQYEFPLNLPANFLLAERLEKTFYIGTGRPLETCNSSLTTRALSPMDPRLSRSASPVPAASWVELSPHFCRWPVTVSFP